MIFMVAPGYAANMVFAGAPSGDVYQSNQFGLIYVGSGGAPDQVFLQSAGCATLVPFGNYAPPPLSAWKLAATGCNLSAVGTPNSYANQGGFELPEMHRQASLLQVVEAIEGPMRLNVCLTATAACNRQGWCPAHPVWVKAQRAMAEVLANACIGDLSREALATRWN